MVSPFMAFAKGAFEGYNNMRQQEREFEYQMALEQEKRITAASKIEAPQMFQVMGQDSSGSTTTYDLFNLAEKDTFGDVKERGQENITRFYNTTLKPIKEVMPKGHIFPAGHDTSLSVIDYFEQYDQHAYTNLKARHDDYANAWVDRNSREPSDTNPRMQYTHGSTFTLSKNHPFSTRFNEIAMRKLPLGVSKSHLVRTFVANNGAFLETVPYSSYVNYGNTDKEIRTNLVDKALDVAHIGGKTMGVNTKEIVDNHLNKYTPDMWNAYIEAEQVFKNVRFSGGTLDEQSRIALTNIVEDDRYRNTFKRKDGTLNTNAITTFFRMGTEGVHYLMGDNASTFSTITGSDDYVRNVLFNEKGIEGMKDRASASMSALQTIKQLEATFPKQLQDLTINEQGQLVTKDGQVFNPADLEENNKMFTGLPAEIVKLFVGIASPDGAWAQIKSAVTGSGLEFGGPNGEAIAREAWMKRLNIGAAGISVREMLQEILIYQVAAALQGGTGGRTISDNDVQRVANALGDTMFSTARLRYIRLQALKGMMGQIYEVNSLYSNARDVQGYKAADITSQLILGNRLDQMTLGQAADLVNSGITKDDQAIAQIDSDNRVSQGYALTPKLAVTSFDDFLPKGWNEAQGKYDTGFYSDKKMPPQMQHFISLPIEKQREVVINFRYWQKSEAKRQKGQ